MSVCVCCVKATSDLGDDDHYVDHYEQTEVTDSESSDGYEEVVSEVFFNPARVRNVCLIFTQLDPVHLPIIPGIHSPANTPPVSRLIACHNS